MEEILHQLRLVVYPIISKAFFIPGGDRRISEPSTYQQYSSQIDSAHPKSWKKFSRINPPGADFFQLSPTFSVCVYPKSNLEVVLFDVFGLRFHSSLSLLAIGPVVRIPVFKPEKGVKVRWGKPPPFGGGETWDVHQSSHVVSMVILPISWGGWGPKDGT